MFKEKLKNDLDKLKPKEQVKSAILSKLKNEKIKPSKRRIRRIERKGSF